MGMNVPAYRWARTIKELDENRCAFCGATLRLEAHHINQIAANPEQATDLENGITLCHKCHYTAHGADYTTKSHIGRGYRGYSSDPKLMQDFISDYASRKIVIAVPKGQKEKIKAHAERFDGGSVNGFINRAIENQMSADEKEGAGE